MSSHAAGVLPPACKTKKTQYFNLPYAVETLYTPSAMAPATTPYESAPMPDNRSLLLELPRELRNHIYDMVLEDEVRLPHCCSAAQSGPVTSTALIRVRTSPFPHLATMLTSRRPAAKSTPSFWRDSAFPPPQSAPKW